MHWKTEVVNKEQHRIYQDFLSFYLVLTPKYWLGRWRLGKQSRRGLTSDFCPTVQPTKPTTLPFFFFLFFPSPFPFPSLGEKGGSEMMNLKPFFIFFALHLVILSNTFTNFPKIKREKEHKTQIFGLHHCSSTSGCRLCTYMRSRIACYPTGFCSTLQLVGSSFF